MLEKAEREGQVKPGDTLIEATSGKKLLHEIPNSFCLNQYTNPANIAAHYTLTAQEILNDIGEGLAMVVISVGTGGTITGLAKKCKEIDPQIQIIGADPYGSILIGGTEVHPYLVEGIGYDFIPEILDNNLSEKSWGLRMG